MSDPLVLDTPILSFDRHLAAIDPTAAPIPPYKADGKPRSFLGLTTWSPFDDFIQPAPLARAESEVAAPPEPVVVHEPAPFQTPVEPEPTWVPAPATHPWPVPAPPYVPPAPDPYASQPDPYPTPEPDPARHRSDAAATPEPEPEHQVPKPHALEPHALEPHAPELDTSPPPEPHPDPLYELPEPAYQDAPPTTPPVDLTPTPKPFWHAKSETSPVAAAPVPVVQPAAGWAPRPAPQPTIAPVAADPLWADTALPQRESGLLWPGTPPQSRPFADPLPAREAAWEVDPDDLWEAEPDVSGQADRPTAPSLWRRPPVIAAAALVLLLLLVLAGLQLLPLLFGSAQSVTAVFNAPMMVVRAAITGRVVSITANPGQIVEPRSTLLTIHADDANVGDRPVLAGVHGVIRSVETIAGADLASGAPLVRLQDCDRAFLTFAPSAKLAAGETVQVKLPNMLAMPGTVRVSSGIMEPANTLVVALAPGSLPTSCPVGASASVIANRS